MRYPDNFLKSTCTALFFFIFTCYHLPAQAKLVIAQGGAAGHLMAHNLPSVTLAVAMEADIIKMDLVLSRDNEVIVFGSPTLDRGTDVAEIFPTRAREDGQFYVLDFSLDEIRQLTLRDPAGRFPADLHPRLTIPTFGEELSLIRSLEKSLNKQISIAVKITQPWFHHKEERDISVPVLTILQKYGYGMQNDDTFLLSYDAAELQRIAKNLLPEKQMYIKLVQLIEANDGRETMSKEWDEWVSYNYDWMFSNTGIRSLATSVAAIGLPKNMLVDSQGQLKLGNFVKNAHQLGTLIFTFPIQKDDPTRPPFAKSFEEELEFFYFTVGVDGVITDFCGEAVRYLRNRVETLQQPLQEPLQETSQIQEREEPVDPQAATVGNDPLQLTIPLGYEKKE
ncbi:MAG: glycerophosphodiester phosphodiesterase [Desulfocapsa sp.]|nr:glycerophosphodiester phosphodiesterase [Desulfocapsa sp.]